MRRYYVLLIITTEYNIILYSVDYKRCYFKLQLSDSIQQGSRVYTGRVSQEFVASARTGNSRSSSVLDIVATADTTGSGTEQFTYSSFDRDTTLAVEPSLSELPADWIFITLKGMVLPAPLLKLSL